MNKKMLPREIKLKEKVEELRRTLSLIKEDLQQSESTRHRMVEHINGLNGMIADLRSRNSDLEDFKSFARFALPHLKPKREMIAVNEASERKS